MARFPDVKPKVAGEDSYEILDPPIDTTDEIIDLDDDFGFEFPDACPICDYDLRGNVESMVCSECGADIPATVARIDERKIQRANLINSLGMFRWVLYGLIPIALWAPVAFALERAGSIYLTWTVLPAGFMIAIVSTIWATLKAGGETRADKVGIIAFVCLALGVANFGIYMLVLLQINS